MRVLIKFSRYSMYFMCLQSQPFIRRAIVAFITLDVSQTKGVGYGEGSSGSHCFAIGALGSSPRPSRSTRSIRFLWKHARANFESKRGRVNTERLGVTSPFRLIGTRTSKATADVDACSFFGSCPLCKIIEIGNMSNNCQQYCSCSIV